MSLISLVELWPPFSPAAGSPTVTAPDLFHAVCEACHADGGLQSDFGASTFAWMSRGGLGQTLPYSVIDEGPRLPIAEPLVRRGERSQTIAGTFTVTTFAATRGQARTLGRVMGDAIEAASVAGELANLESLLVDVERTGDESGAKDPEPGPDGRAVYAYRVEYRYLIHED